MPFVTVAVAIHAPVTAANVEECSAIAVDALRRMCDYAAPKRVKLVFEATNHLEMGKYVNTAANHKRARRADGKGRGRSSRESPTPEPRLPRRRRDGLLRLRPRERLGPRVVLKIPRKGVSPSSPDSPAGAAAVSPANSGRTHAPDPRGATRANCE